MRISPLLYLLGVAAGASALAQTPKTPERHVRFLALGEMPPFRQEIRGDVRYELEPPEGSIPPREVLLGSAEGRAETTPLRLGLITAPLKIPSGAGPLILRRPGNAADAKPWLQLARPDDEADFLVLLWRAAVKGTWNEAKFFVLPDGPLAAPAGSVRIVNISPVEVRVVIGEEKLILGAGKSFQRLMRGGTNLAFQILMNDSSGNLKTLYSGDILQNDGERSLALVYRADGESPRRPVKVTVLREPVPAAVKDSR